MRLIDADDLISYLEQVTVTEGITSETVFKQVLTDIKNQPTAFDPEKVIDRLREVSEKTATARIPHLYYKSVSVRKATEIIRGGVCNGK